LVNSPTAELIKGSYSRVLEKHRNKNANANENANANAKRD